MFHFVFTEDNSTLDYSEYLTFSHPEKCRINQRHRYNDSACNNTDESRNKMNGNIKISSLEEINQHDSEKNGWVEPNYIGWSQGKL